ncbi:hypothetical protein CEXT_629091 [Caerostris extrusa]|uniref:Uncharacterized protein n=1 Tax=Caerostris extrusa TaxID=172846 RepID=A0AAV4W2E7_CAEEX|nr:hypothetical protein CEXT_629091 [Caerostris extrusa]
MKEETESRGTHCYLGAGFNWSASAWGPRKGAQPGNEEKRGIRKLELVCQLPHSIIFFTLTSLCDLDIFSSTLSGAPASSAKGQGAAALLLRPSRILKSR